MTAWTPIALAPKDGTRILIGWCNRDGASRVGMAAWDALHQRWHAFCNEKRLAPIAWQPLPTFDPETFNRSSPAPTEAVQA